MSAVMLNYVSVGPDASPIEVLRAEALDDALTSFFGQSSLARVAGGTVCVVASFEAGRLERVQGVAFDGGAGDVVSRVASFRLSRRMLRFSFQRLCEAFEGPDGQLPTVFVIRVHRGSGEFMLELGYDDEARGRWDVEASGLEGVAKRVAALSDGSVAG